MSLTFIWMKELGWQTFLRYLELSSFILMVDIVEAGYNFWGLNCSHCFLNLYLIGLVNGGPTNSSIPEFMRVLLQVPLHCNSLGFTSVHGVVSLLVKFYYL